MENSGLFTNVKFVFKLTDNTIGWTKLRIEYKSVSFKWY